MITEEQLQGLVLSAAQVLDLGTDAPREARLAAGMALKLIAEVRRLRTIEEAARRFITSVHDHATAVFMGQDDLADALDGGRATDG